jgi:hypothetical protein
VVAVVRIQLRSIVAVVGGLPPDNVNRSARAANTPPIVDLELPRLVDRFTLPVVVDE